jgi:hypothetical protein
MARIGTKSDDQYSDQEAKRRTEAALRAAFNTPAKPQSEMKLGKSKSEKVQSLKSQRMDRGGRGKA